MTRVQIARLRNAGSVGGLCLAGMALASPPLHAASIPPTSTNWAISADVPQFDPAQGSLHEIGFGLTGTLTGTIGVESLEPLPGAVSAGISSTISLFAPGGNGPVLSVTPGISVGASLPGFDGKIDFAGASGRTFSGLSATQSAQTTYTAGMPGLQIPTAPFIGAGTVALPVTASASASLAGPLNLAARTQAAAGADVSVQYNAAASQPAATSGGGGFTGGFTWFNFPPIGIEHAPVQTLTLSDQPGNWTRNVSFNRFDPALGTLVSADLTMQGDVKIALSVQNTGAGAASYNVGSTVTFNLLRPDGTSLLDAVAASTRSGTLDPFAGVDDFSGPFGATASDDFLSSLEAISAGSGGDLSLFAGTGPLTLQLEAIGLLLADLPGSADLLSSALEGAQLSISYSYLPGAGADRAASASEPGSLALLAMSLLGLGWWRCQKGLTMRW